MAEKLVVSLIEETQEYQRFLADDARRAAKTAGFVPEIVFADSNAIVQIRQLYQYVHAAPADRPAAIVAMTVSGRGGDKLAQDAVEAGIGWILVNRDADYFEELRRKAPRVPSFAVNVDHAEVGRIQGRLLRALVPGGGPVLYVKGPPETAPAVGRQAGIDEALRGSNFDFSTVFGDWSEASAEKAITAWLRLAPDDVRAVVGQNDAMAVAAHAALAKARPACLSLPVIGCDGLPSVGQRLVREGRMTATVVVPPPISPAIELLVRALRTGEMPPPVTRLPLQPFPS